MRIFRKLLKNKHMENQKNKQSEKEAETQVVNKDALSRILAELDQLKKDNQMLKEVADKSRLATWEAKNRQDLKGKVGLRTFRNKVILAWLTTEDMVEKNEQGIWQEKQDIEVVYEDGKKEVLPYRTFAMQFQKIDGEVISKTETDGKITYKVKADNGKEYEIADTFLN